MMYFVTADIFILNMRLQDRIDTSRSAITNYNPFIIEGIE